MTPPVRQAPNVRQRQLGMALRRLREEASLSADDAAEQLGCSQTKISRIEQARINVGKGDLYFLLDLYGVKDDESQLSYWTLALAGRQKGWWAAYKDVIPETLSDYISFESAASNLSTWSLGTIHGLLQTEAYARATFAGGRRRTADEVDRVVSARMERQGRLGSGDLSLWAILDESLLSRPVGGPAVLRDQLDHLLNLPDGVTLQVVPIGTNWHPGLNCAFTLMEFRDYPAVTFVDTSGGDTYVDVEEVVATYILLFDQLRAAGANPAESAGLIEAARDRIKL